MDGKVTAKGLEVGSVVWVVFDEDGQGRAANRKDAKRQVSVKVTETWAERENGQCIGTDDGWVYCRPSQWFTLVDANVTTDEVAPTVSTPNDAPRGGERDRYLVINVYGGEVHALSEGMDTPLCETPIRRYTVLCETERLEFGHGTCHLCAERTQIL